MKKRLLFFFVFTIHMISFAQTNVYYPFPTTMAIWNDHGYADTYLELRYDTVFNGHTYKQIHNIWHGDTALVNPLSTYNFALREENKKIFAFFQGDTTEHLLYDFSVSAGDSIRYDYSMTFSTPRYFTRYVSSIDSILLQDGHYRKRFNLTEGDNCYLADTVVEGIGSISWKGLLNPLETDVCTCAHYYNLVCFWEYDTTRYYNHWGGCFSCFCNMYLGVDEIKTVGEPEVYPNPFTNETTITVDKELKNATLVVYNAFGQQVKQAENISGTTMKLRRDDLPVGIYFISFLENNAVLTTGRLVITD